MNLFKDDLSDREQQLDYMAHPHQWEQRPMLPLVMVRTPKRQRGGILLHLVGSTYILYRDVYTWSEPGIFNAASCQLITDLTHVLAEGWIVNSMP